MKTKSGYYFFEFITTATSLADSLLHTSHLVMPTVYYILHTPSCRQFTDSTSHTFMSTVYYIFHTPSCRQFTTYFTHLHADSLLHTSHIFMSTVYYILHTPSCRQFTTYFTHLHADSLLHTSHIFMSTVYYILHTPSCRQFTTYFTHLHADSLLHTSHIFMSTVYYILHTPSCRQFTTYFTHLHADSLLHTSHIFMVCFKHTGWPQPSHLLFTLPMLSFFTLCPTPWVLSRQILHLLGILSFGGGGWLSGSFSPTNFIIDDFSVIVKPPCSMRLCICGATREFTNNHPKSKLLNPLIELFASYTVCEFMRAMFRTYYIATIVHFPVLGFIVSDAILWSGISTPLV